MSLALAALPILLVLLAGYGLAASGTIPRANWAPINALCFRLLFPVVLITSIAETDLAAAASGRWFTAVLGTLALSGLAALSLRFFVSRKALPDPGLSTLFQTTTRWNGFMALAAADQFLGPQGMMLLAVAIAVLVPVTNLANIAVLVRLGDGNAGVGLGGTLMSLVRNPLVQGAMIGLAINFSGLTIPPLLMETLDLVGRGALGLALLCVGAGVVASRLFDITWRLWAGVLLRYVLGLGLFMALAVGLDLTQQEVMAGCLIFALPAAANGYILAQQMGGDADLYADVLTWQTVLTIPLLPVMALLVTAAF